MRAIADANVTSGTDTVTFPLKARGRTTLGSTLTVSGPLTIEGPETEENYAKELKLSHSEAMMRGRNILPRGPLTVNYCIALSGTPISQSPIKSVKLFTFAPQASCIVVKALK